MYVYVCVYVCPGCCDLGLLLSSREEEVTTEVSEEPSVWKDEERRRGG